MLAPIVEIQPEKGNPASFVLWRTSVVLRNTTLLDMEENIIIVKVREESRAYYFDRNLEEKR